MSRLTFPNNMFFLVRILVWNPFTVHLSLINVCTHVLLPDVGGIMPLKICFILRLNYIVRQSQDRTATFLRPWLCGPLRQSVLRGTPDTAEKSRHSLSCHHASLRISSGRQQHRSSNRFSWKRSSTCYCQGRWICRRDRPLCRPTIGPRRPYPKVTGQLHVDLFRLFLIQRIKVIFSLISYM